MPSHSGSIDVPDAALEDKEAIELARVWASGGKQYASIDVHVWNDPASWGIMLVDLARHVAAAYAVSGKLDAASALDRLREGFDAEWGTSTNSVYNSEKIS